MNPLEPATFQKIRLACYVTWAIIEPAGLVILIMFCLKIIKLLEAMQL